jgi:hypothetical protein
MTDTEFLKAQIKATQQAYDRGEIDEDIEYDRLMDYLEDNDMSYKEYVGQCVKP